MSPGVVVVGEALIDLVPGAEPASYSARLGGSPYNVAIGLARLGHRTYLKARLAPDGFGRQLRAHAEAESVRLDHAIRAAEPTTLAVVTLDSHGSADYAFYVAQTADWQWTAAELAPWPADVRIAHFGSLASWLPPGDQIIHDWVAAARDRDVVVSYDPNIRPRLQPDPAAARAAVERSVAISPIVKASAEDVKWLYPDVDQAAVARNWLERGAQLVVITDGARGARVRTASGLDFTRPARSIALVDTVGAGDAFMSGLLGGLLSHDLARIEALRDPDRDRLAAAVDQATLSAALTCERVGADPPRRHELDLKRR